jgi:hypothetical protein
MTLWRSLRSEKKAARHLLIEHGELSYFRNKGAVTRIQIDSLVLAKLKVIDVDIYWYLEDDEGNFVLIPESIPEIGQLRRYLSAWRGFNYDGLLNFDITQQTEVQLWPIEEVLAS